MGKLSSFIDEDVKSQVGTIFVQSGLSISVLNMQENESAVEVFTTLGHSMLVKLPPVSKCVGRAYSIAFVSGPAPVLVADFGDDPKWDDLTLSAGSFLVVFSTGKSWAVLFNSAGAVPIIHAASHAAGGDDPVSLAGIGAIAKAGDTDLGTMTFLAGQGVKFGSGEILNVHEQGAWTPVVRGADVAGTAEYVTRAGRYFRFGSFVWVQAKIVLSSFSGASGILAISGLPVVTRSVADLEPPMMALCSNHTIASASYPQIAFVPIPNTDYGILEKSGPGGLANVTAAEIGNNFIIQLSGIYQGS